MITRADLPGLLGEIADATDIDTALIVARAVGGTRVDIPRHAPDGHWLIALVGRARADHICAGLTIEDADGSRRGVRHEVIPRGPMGVMSVARRNAIDALESGQTARQAARTAGLHERTVFRLRKRMGGGQGGDQGEMF